VKGGTLRTLAIAGLAIVVAVLLGGWTLQRGRNFGRETARIAEVLELRDGMSVADIGAGDGRYSIFLAEQVGASGRVFATEVEQDMVDDIRETADGHANVTVILGGADATGLPDECCDRILLRTVYHHFVDPDSMGRSMLASLKPGGIIAVVDFGPRGSAPQGVPGDRGGHGVPIDLLVEEMTDYGFELVGEVDDWPGGRNDYCVIFRKPEG